jgi:hypothetical protein
MKEVTVLELRRNLAAIVAPLVCQEESVYLVKLHGQPSFGLTTPAWAGVIADTEVCDQGGAVLSAEEVGNIFARISGAFEKLGQKLSVEQLVTEFVRQAKIVSDFHRLQEQMKRNEA